MGTLAKPLPQSRRPWKRLRPEEVSDIRRLSAAGVSVSELARRFGSGWATIRDAIHATGAYSEAKAARKRERPMASGGHPLAGGDEADPAPVSTLARLESARRRVGKAGRAELPAVRFAFVVAQASHYEALFHDSEDSLKEAKTPKSKQFATARRDEAYRRWQAALRYCP